MEPKKSLTKHMITTASFPDKRHTGTPQQRLAYTKPLTERRTTLRLTQHCALTATLLDILF